MTRRDAERICKDATGRMPIRLLGGIGGFWRAEFPSGRRAKVFPWGLQWERGRE